MTDPLDHGGSAGEWTDDKHERRLVSLAERRLAEAVARIAELEALLMVMTGHATNTSGGYLAKDHPDVLRARELTK